MIKEASFVQESQAKGEKKHDLDELSTGTHPCIGVPGKQKVKRSIQNTPLCYSYFLNAKKAGAQKLVPKITSPVSLALSSFLKEYPAATNSKITAFS